MGINLKDRLISWNSVCVVLVLCTILFVHWCMTRPEKQMYVPPKSTPASIPVSTPASVYTVYSKNCESCNGSGDCRYCNGTGHYPEDPDPNFANLMKRDGLGNDSQGRCLRCGGTGKCQECNGTGINPKWREEQSKAEQRLQEQKGLTAGR